MLNRVKDNYAISGFFVFFLVGVCQSSGNVLSFQNHVLAYAGQDAWLSILLMGLSLHLVVWMIYKMLGHPAQDIMDLHRTIFGKILGNGLSVLLVGYFFVMALFYFRAYIEIVQVWVFPSLRTWAMAGLLMVLIYYVVSGGFRVVAGYSFFYMALIPMILLLYFPIRQGDLHRLLPAFNHSVLDVLKGSRSASFVFFGLEALLVYFPFLKLPEKNAKWAHFALLFTTFKYCAMIVVSLMYFSQGLLKHTQWPTLAVSKIIELSFFARFEYFYIFMWLLAIIPTVCISFVLHPYHETRRLASPAAVPADHVGGPLRRRAHVQRANGARRLAKNRQRDGLLFHLLLYPAAVHHRVHCRKIRLQGYRIGGYLQLRDRQPRLRIPDKKSRAHPADAFGFGLPAALSGRRSAR